MTPRLLEREFEAARLRSVDQFRRDTTQAWQTVRFYGAFKSERGLQPLSSYLDDGEKRGGSSLPPPQTALQAQAALEVIAAQHGLRMRKAKP